MVIPIVGRVRRRRLMLMMAMLVLFSLYMGLFENHGNDLAQFTPDTPPQDDDTPPTTPDRQPEHEDPPNSAGEPLGQLEETSLDETTAISPTSDAESAGEEKKESNRDKRKKKKVLRYKDPTTLPMIMMQYGTAARPPVKGLANVVKEQPVELIVGGSTKSKSARDLSASTATDESPQVLRRRRFVFIGDVHGERQALERLLQKIKFDSLQDHLILTGDLVNKGPDSAGVVSLAMKLGASAVRGNHEDRVLLSYESMRALQGSGLVAGGRLDSTATKALSDEEIANERHRKKALIEAEGRRERAIDRLEIEEAEREADAQEGGFLRMLGLKNKKDDTDENTYIEIDHERIQNDLNIDSLEQDPFSHGDGPERAAAAQLTPNQARWLSDLPTILHLGPLAPPEDPLPSSSQSSSAKGKTLPSPFTNDVVVVHAGLVPGVPLENQDPYAVMTMRSLVHPADEVRHERARAAVEHRTRTQLRGQYGANDPIAVSKRQIEREFKKQQEKAYGKDPQHPHMVRKSSSRSSISSQPESAGSQKFLGDLAPPDRVMVPIEAHFSEGVADKDKSERQHWAVAWNQAQHVEADVADRMTVVYGHDAVTGLAVPPSELPQQGWMSWMFGFGMSANHVDIDTGYTFGLDTGCVYGGQLTALIVETDKDGRVVHHIEQVECPEGAAAKKRKKARKGKP